LYISHQDYDIVLTSIW